MKHKIQTQRVAIALGILISLCTLFLGLTGTVLGWGLPIIHLIGSLYLGYDATITGSIIGAIWGFLDGYIGGVLFGLVYNRLGKP